MVGQRDKTLEQLDGDVLGVPKYDSNLVLNCHRLRRVPLNEFTAEDVRLMIGQDLALNTLRQWRSNILKRTLLSKVIIILVTCSRMYVELEEISGNTFLNYDGRCSSSQKMPLISCLHYSLLTRLDKI